MNEYLLLFRNISGSNSYITTPEDMARDMADWQGWIGQVAMQGKLVSTQPVEYQGTIVSNEGVKPGPDKSAANILVAGFMICKSDDPSEVVAWSKTCPILKYPHGSVEIRPLVPFPIH